MVLSEGGRTREVLIGRSTYVDSRAGVRVVRGARVVSVEGDEDSGVAKTSDETWRGRVIGLATGKHGLHGIKRPRGSMVGFKTHLSSPGAKQIMSSMVQLAFFAGGYAGACSIEMPPLSGPC
jgi:flavin-dependent dehydrogenase